MADDEVNHGWGISDHNEGQGISFTVQFTPLPKAGEKRRKNAALKTVSRIVYIHEDMGLRDMITKIVVQLKRQDFFQDLEIINDEITQAPFDIHYTIARTALKNIQLLCTDDYATLLREVIAKAHPALVLTVIEKKVVNENKIIANLQVQYRCEDRRCSFDFCWPDGETAKHIHLTHLHLRTWSAALDAKEAGVDRDTPPNIKLFDVSYFGNNTDAHALSRRRLVLQQQNQNIAPTVNFQGLADVIRELNPATSANQYEAPIIVPVPAAPLPILSHPTLPPKMSLDAFCVHSDLSNAIKNKLTSINVTGPHVLRLIDDIALRKEAGLDIGELATVRDAEERWMEMNRH